MEQQEEQHENVDCLPPCRDVGAGPIFDVMRVFVSKKFCFIQWARLSCRPRQDAENWIGSRGGVSHHDCWSLNQRCVMMSSVSNRILIP